MAERISMFMGFLIPLIMFGIVVALVWAMEVTPDEGCKEIGYDGGMLKAGEKVCYRITQEWDKNEGMFVREYYPYARDTQKLIQQNKN